MGPLGVQQDEYVTDRLLATSSKGSQLYIATGYFNLTSKYMGTLMHETEAECKLLMAHPDVCIIS